VRRRRLSCAYYPATRQAALCGIRLMLATARRIVWCGWCSRIHLIARNVIEHSFWLAGCQAGHPGVRGDSGEELRARFLQQ